MSARACDCLGVHVCAAQDLSVGNVRAASALSSREDEATRARQQAESLARELAEARRAGEELRGSRDQLQVRGDVGKPVEGREG